MSDTGFSLRDILSANDAANAARFDAIQAQLEKNERDRRDTESDHEQRLRTLEKKSVWGNIADALIGIGAVIAGVIGTTP